MMSKPCSIGSALFLFAFGCGLCAAPWEQPAAAVSTRDSAAVKSEAFAALDAWRGLKADRPDVYAAGEYVFSYAVCGIDNRKAGSSARAKATMTAEAAAVAALTDSVIKSVFAGTSGTDRLARSYAASARLHFNGRFVVSDCSAERCEAVFQTTKAEVDGQKAKLDKKRFLEEAKRDFKAQPQAYGAFLAESGFPDAALVFRMRRQSAALFNVPLPVVPTQVQAAAFERFASERRRHVSTLLKSASTAGASPEESLALRAVIGLDEEANFHKALVESGIPLLKWSPEQPLLKAVAALQGFVRFENRAASDSPVSMTYVRQLFVEGKHLALAVALLEDGAARHPANPEVWEYLAAGYYAAGNRDAARIAVRVWLSLAKDANAPLTYLATHFDADGNGRVVAQLLQ